MNLKEQNYRFMYLGNGEYEWVHETRIEKDFIDCTDMTDNEFDDFVFNNQVTLDRRFRGV